MTDYKFGDLICYRGAEPHDAPLMYIGPCGHRLSGQLSPNNGLIDIMDIEGKYIIDLDHKDPSMWQVCYHEFDGSIIER